LTNPRTRIAAELGWLPGVAPSRATTYCLLLHQDLDAFLASASHENPLVKANLLAAAVERFDPAMATSEWVAWIIELAKAADGVDLEIVRRILNEDRAVAGFPEIPTVNPVEAEWVDRRRTYHDTIKQALDRMPTLTLLDVVSGLIETALAGGTSPGSPLIDDVADMVEVEARPFFDREAENARRLIQPIIDSGGANEEVVDRLLTGLERVLRNWDRIARPLQKNMRARGVDHLPSQALARDVRELAITFNNTWGLVAAAQRITRLSQDVFGGLTAMEDQLNEDAIQLATIVGQQRAASQQAETWAREITYNAEIGWGWKRALRIAPDGLEWNGTRYPLESITRVGWGGTRHSVNMIPTGTTYTILFGDDTRLSEVHLSDQRIFKEFVDRLWWAVGARLLMEWMRGLRDGGRYDVGAALLDDRGMELTKHQLFKANKQVYATWDRLSVWTAEGSFHIGVKDDRAVSVTLPYQQANNAHVLEAAIRMAFKRGASRLSDILEPDARRAEY
jgi:hypothetical protein